MPHLVVDSAASLSKEKAPPIKGPVALPLNDRPLLSESSSPEEALSPPLYFATSQIDSPSPDAHVLDAATSLTAIATPHDRASLSPLDRRKPLFEISPTASTTSHRKLSSSGKPVAASNLLRAVDLKGSTSLRSRRLKHHSPTESRGLGREPRKPWRKLLWIKQDYPDNWTDTSFLAQLERNVDVRPYDFWPLVAECTVITQHVSTVVIFVTSFIAIFTERASPVTIAGCSTLATVLGYFVWEHGQQGQEHEEESSRGEVTVGSQESLDLLPPAVLDSTLDEHKHPPKQNVLPNPLVGVGLGLVSQEQRAIDPLPSLLPASVISPPTPTELHASSTAASPLESPWVDTASAVVKPNLVRPSTSPALLPSPAGTNTPPFHSRFPSLPSPSTPISRASSFPDLELDEHPSPRPSRRARHKETLKSSILIYCTLLGLSPILKSLTKSTSSDSIWAVSTWLFLANCFFFDYGSIASQFEERRTRHSSTSQSSPSPLNAAPPIPAVVTPVVDATDPASTAPLPFTASFSNRTKPGVQFPASLSTNAALMSSVVLASRLPSTTAVFSLLLFSIQVFGLFPVFRHFLLQHYGLRAHLALTGLLWVCGVIGVGTTVSWWWAGVWGVGVGVGVGVGGPVGLMRMQRYKNALHAPWDPARPVFRRRGEGG